MPSALEGHLELVTAIKAGQVDTVKRLIDANPSLVTDPYPDDPRSLLHHANDWPGKIANGPAIIALLVGAGADPNASYGGEEHSETPLHWAASADDTAAVTALLDNGAAVDATGGVFDSCTPIVDAVIFEQYEAAELLLARGATTNLPVVAAVGRLDLVEQHFDDDGQLRMERNQLRFGPQLPPPQTLVDRGFQWACRGGHLEVAQFLLAHGADPAAQSAVDTTALEDATENGHDDVVAWLSNQLAG